MPQYYRVGSEGSHFDFTIPPGIKALLFINSLIFVLTQFTPSGIVHWLGLVPAAVVKGAIWQVFTYQFFHAGIGHILFNMLTLWMFGTAVETTWGMRRFLRYYLVCGTGAGVCVVLAAYLVSSPLERMVTTIGASGAIFGVLLAFGVMFPNAPVWMFFLFRVPAKIAVIIFGAIELFGFTEGGGPVSHVAHLGGLLVGFLYLRYSGLSASPYGYRSRSSGLRGLTRWFSPEEWRIAYKQWQGRRLRKKFEIYRQRHDKTDYIQ
jgi:membrane associated rhomboid family serine protease